MFAAKANNPYSCAWLEEILSGIESSQNIEEYVGFNLIQRGYGSNRSLYRHYGKTYFMAYSAQFALRNCFDENVRFFDGKQMKVAFSSKDLKLLMTSKKFSDFSLIKVIGYARNNLCVSDWSHLHHNSTFGETLQGEELDFLFKILVVEERKFHQTLKSKLEEKECTFSLSRSTEIIQDCFSCNTCPVSNSGKICAGCFKANFEGPRYECNCTPGVSLCGVCLPKFQKNHEHTLIQVREPQILCFSCATVCHKGHDLEHKGSIRSICFCKNCGNKYYPK
jgi:hypothetical protein